MGVKERKERDKVEMREKILQSAHQLFLDRGFEEISIRSIAEAIEYSPATIYLYFKDKNEIVHALHQNGFKLLNEYFKDLINIADPFERLLQMGKAYIGFATENPGTYELLFMRSEPMEHIASCLDDHWMEGDSAFGNLLQTIEQCQSKGDFEKFDPQYLAMMIWSSIHGLCSLRISNHLGHVKGVRDSNLNLDEVMMSTFDTFNQMLAKLR